MEIELLQKYGGGGVTLLHPLALGFLLTAGILMVLVPRRYVMGPLLAGSLFIPTAQRIVISDLDFMVPRILILFGWSRLLIRNELRAVKLHPIDRAVMLYVGISVISYSILYGAWGAFVNRLGFAFDIVGFYFLLRLIGEDFEDVCRIVKMLVVFAVPVAMFMTVEQASGQNLFAVFGGVPEVTFVRDGSLRSQGAFSHPISAGMFGATLFPLAVSLVWCGKSRGVGLVGSLGCVIIVGTAASSGPVAAFIAGILGLGLWHIRKHMRQLRWGIVLLLVGAHMVMKAPVWALLQRFSVFGGTGWQRYILVDEFINRFGEWWYLGTRSTAHWGWQNSTDITNMYIMQGISGGMFVLVLFIAIIARSFRAIGEATHAAENPARQKGAWALGASLFAHVVGFLGVAYFDQMQLVWYILLAMVTLAGSSAGRGTEHSVSPGSTDQGPFQSPSGRRLECRVGPPATC